MTEQTNDPIAIIHHEKKEEDTDWKEIEEGLVYELSGRALELGRCYDDLGGQIHPVESRANYARRLAGRAVRLADLFEQQVRLQDEIENAEKALARARSAKRRRRP